MQVDEPKTLNLSDLLGITELWGHLTYCINVLSADDGRRKIFFEPSDQALYRDLPAQLCRKFGYNLLRAGPSAGAQSVEHRQASIGAANSPLSPLSARSLTQPGKSDYSRN
jgi:hypothetical protein